MFACYVYLKIDQYSFIKKILILLLDPISGEVLLVDVENRETLHTSVMDSNIVSLTWVQEQQPSNDSSKEKLYHERCKSSSGLFSPVCTNLIFL